MKASIIKAGIAGGVVGIALVLLSPLNACIGYLGYLVAIGVGVLAVYLGGRSLTASQGAVDGAIAGAIAGIIDGVVGAGVGILRMNAAVSNLGVPSISPAGVAGATIPAVIGG